MIERKNLKKCHNCKGRGHQTGIKVKGICLYCKGYGNVGYNKNMREYERKNNKI